MKARLAKLVFGALLAAAPSAVLAHHSFAMFDNQKTVTLEGTVVEFQWTNPHVWIELRVRQPNNNSDAEWSIEGGSAASLARQGWRRGALKPGDRASVTIHPLKDGTNGGLLVAVTVNGQQVGAMPG